MTAESTHAIGQDPDIGMEESSGRYGWIAMIALLTVVGLILWFIFSGTEDTA